MGNTEHPTAGLGGEKPSLHLPRGPLHPQGAAGAAPALESSAHPRDSPKALAAQGICDSNTCFFLYGYRMSNMMGTEQRRKKPGLLLASLPCRILQEALDRYEDADTSKRMFT